MKQFLFIFLLLKFSIFLSAQKCIDKIPENLDLKNEDDFKQYENDILECINWLSDNPIDKDNISRNRALKFIHEWGKETPDYLFFPYSNISNVIFKDLRKKAKSKQYGIDLYMCYYSGMIKYHLDKRGRKKIFGRHYESYEFLIRKLN